MKKNKTKSALRTVIIVCIAVFLVINIYLLNVQTLQGNALPMPFGVGAAIVLSGSMEPELSIDDLIIVVAQEGYQVGDVVVYQSGKSLVVHRIIEISDGLVVTQGDANNTTDEPVELALIKGEVVYHVDDVGGLARMVKSPVVSFGLMGLAIFLLERSFRRDKQEEDDKIREMEEELRRLKEQTEG